MTKFEIAITHVYLYSLMMSVACDWYTCFNDSFNLFVLLFLFFVRFQLLFCFVFFILIASTMEERLKRFIMHLSIL